MTAFVITHQDSEFLDTPIFHAGPEQQQEAIAVFTNREVAQEYIDTAAWSEHYGVGELKPIQILNWFECAHEDGVDMVVINPDRNWHPFGDRQEVILLDEPREAFARLLRSELIPKVDKQQFYEHEHQPHPIAHALRQFQFHRNETALNDHKTSRENDLA